MISRLHKSIYMNELQKQYIKKRGWFPSLVAVSKWFKEIITCPYRHRDHDLLLQEVLPQVHR